MTEKHKLHFEGCLVTVDGNTWSTEKPVIDAKIKNGVVLLILDYDQYPDNRVACNLEGYSINGERLWVAENPTDTPNEAYVEFLADGDVLDNTVEVSDLAGFRCDVDINTGTLVNVVYSK